MIVNPRVADMVQTAGLRSAMAAQCAPSGNARKAQAGRLMRFADHAPEEPIVIEVADIIATVLSHLGVR